MNDAGQAGVDQPLQLRRTARHVDAGDGAFAQADAASARGRGRSRRAAVTIRPVAVAGDQLCYVLVEIGIMADHQHSLAVGVLGDELLKGGVIAVGRKRRRGEDGRFKADLGADELCGLAGALERTGDDYVDLRVERGQHAGHQHALLLAFLDQAAFGIEERISAWNASIGMAHEVEIHWFQFDEA